MYFSTFSQLSARLKNFLGGWLLVMGIKEDLVECATVCVKSVVILEMTYMNETHAYLMYLPSTVAGISHFCPKRNWPFFHSKA